MQKIIYKTIQKLSNSHLKTNVTNKDYKEYLNDLILS